MTTQPGETRQGWTHKLADPALAQAELVYAHRQGRNMVLDDDLLGEPAWDILLMTFIASGKGRVCKTQDLGEELHLASCAATRWTSLLASRGLIEVNGKTIVITRRAETQMRELFNTHMRAFLLEFGAGEGPVQFSSGAIPEQE